MLLISSKLLIAQPQNNPNSQVVVGNPNQSTEPAKKIQMVFCLDVTGSMQGLIATAKQKIWSIASSLLQTDPKPELELGMVFYRDRGDKFVTQKIEFTQNIDALYARLMEIAADGGGDAPESVNQALYDAINAFKWKADTGVYKAVFLVGDCPPHMNYPDDVKYPVTCRLALKKDIIINTLKMGTCDGAESVWKEVAMITGGDYIAVDQNANGYVVATPYDSEIAKLQNTIDNSVVFYGTVKIRTGKENEKMVANTIYKNGKTYESASRAEYKTAKGAKSDAYYKQDLVTDVANGSVKTDTLKTEYLPEDLQKMTLEERTLYILKLKQERDTAEAKLKLCVEQRNNYIKIKSENEITESSKSFNSNIYKSIQKQTAKKGVVLKGKVKE